MAQVRVRSKTWKYRNTLEWTNGRRGVLSAENRPDIPAGTPADFGGDDDTWGPEDFYVAAVNSCTMATFLYLQNKLGFELVGYSSDAEGTMESSGGKTVITRVEVWPHIVVASETDRAKAKEAIHQAEQMCVITDSVTAQVTVEPQIDVAAGGA